MNRTIMNEHLHRRKRPQQSPKRTITTKSCQILPKIRQRQANVAANIQQLPETAMKAPTEAPESQQCRQPLNDSQQP